MSYTNKTPNYELPQYVADDKPTYLGDFNGAMKKIDEVLKTNEEKAINAEGIAEASDATAKQALQVANEAKSEITGDVQTALTNAQEAKQLAQTANTNASQAKTNADSAITIATEAQDEVGGFDERITTAESTAQDAKQTAQSANTTAIQANSKAEEALSKIAGEGSDGFSSIKIEKTESNTSVPDGQNKDILTIDVEKSKKINLLLFVNAENRSSLKTATVKVNIKGSTDGSGFSDLTNFSFIRPIQTNMVQTELIGDTFTGYSQIKFNVESSGDSNNIGIKAMVISTTSAEN